MKYLHQILKLKKGAHIKVHFNQSCKILILTRLNYNLYKDHITHNYYGGIFEKSPFEFEIPSNGEWHIVIERGSYFEPKNIVASVTILSS